MIKNGNTGKFVFRRAKGMGIEYLEREGLFRLTAQDTEYVIGIGDGK